MDTDTFMKVVSQAHDRDVGVLIEKGIEYAVDDDRLAQFDYAAVLKETNPALELVGMATKHFTSISLMSKAPNMYLMSVWKEKLTDLRNYMHLLEGLLIDMEVE